MRTGNIRILDRAELPEIQVKPRKKLNIFLAAVVGLVFGLGLAFFFEYLDNTIKIPEDVKNHLKVPYLGPVPAFVVEEDKEAGEDRGVDLMTVTSPKSTASESYRGIRTSILLSSAESEPQVVMVSSAGPGEGKTITTANLAVTMAQSGSKVIMLDCDLRRPKLHKVFGVSRDQGISNILVGKGDPKSIIINTQIDNLDIIPCGPIPPNPSEMLGSARMAGLIAALRKRYDRVIIDTPPATAVTDAVVLSKIADGVVVVVRSGETAREIVKNGIGQFENIGANILGVVLNGVDMGRDSYYYQYYYYYYGEEGKKKTGSHRKKRSTSGYHGREA